MPSLADFFYIKNHTIFIGLGINDHILASTVLFYGEGFVGAYDFCYKKEIFFSNRNLPSEILF